MGLICLLPLLQREWCFFVFNSARFDNLLMGKEVLCVVTTKQKALFGGGVNQIEYTVRLLTRIELCRSF